MKPMTEVYKDDYYEAYNTQYGTRVVLTKDNSRKNYWKVDVVLSAGKVMTIATRCRYERAKEIASYQ